MQAGRQADAGLELEFELVGGWLVDGGYYVCTMYVCIWLLGERQSESVVTQE